MGELDVLLHQVKVCPTTFSDNESGSDDVGHNICQSTNDVFDTCTKDGNNLQDSVREDSDDSLSLDDISFDGTGIPSIDIATTSETKANIAIASKKEKPKKRTYKRRSTNRKKPQKATNRSSTKTLIGDESISIDDIDFAISPEVPADDTTPEQKQEEHQNYEDETVNEPIGFIPSLTRPVCASNSYCVGPVGRDAFIGQICRFCKKWHHLVCAVKRKDKRRQFYCHPCARRNSDNDTNDREDIRNSGDFIETRSQNMYYEKQGDLDIPGLLTVDYTMPIWSGPRAKFNVALYDTWESMKRAPAHTFQAELHKALILKRLELGLDYDDLKLLTEKDVVKKALKEFARLESFAVLLKQPIKKVKLSTSSGVSGLSRHSNRARKHRKEKNWDDEESDEDSSFSGVADTKSDSSPVRKSFRLHERECIKKEKEEEEKRKR
jgi:hypothetical protein